MPETLLNALLEMVDEIGEQVKNWDIMETIKEVNASPELIRLNQEIETLKAINAIFEK